MRLYCTLYTCTVVRGVQNKLKEKDTGKQCQHGNICHKRQTKGNCNANSTKMVLNQVRCLLWEHSDLAKLLVYSFNCTRVCHWYRQGVQTFHPQQSGGRQGVQTFSSLLCGGRHGVQTFHSQLCSSRQAVQTFSSQSSVVIGKVCRRSILSCGVVGTVYRGSILSCVVVGKLYRRSILSCEVGGKVCRRFLLRAV